MPPGSALVWGELGGLGRKDLADRDLLQVLATYKPDVSIGVERHEMSPCPAKGCQ